MKFKAKLSSRIIVFIVILSVLIASFMILLNQSNKIVNNRFDQFGAERWMNNDSLFNYAQISVFLTSETGFSENNIYSLSRSYDEKMMSESISTSEGGRLWLHAYSAKGSVSVDASSNIATDVTAVAGDFFFIHNVPLITGSYFKDDPLNNDHILINETLAWQLFGSFDIVGRDIYIYDQPYSISGVTKNDGDVIDDSLPHLYMQYDVYKELDNLAYISCYEAILPNPISDFALNVVTSLFSFNELEYEIIQNTSRFNLINTFKNLLNLTERNIKTNRVIYPQWENQARITEHKLAYLLLAQIILIFLFICTLTIMIIIYRSKISLFFENNSSKIVTKAKNSKFADKIRNKRRERYEKKKLS